MIKKIQQLVLVSTLTFAIGAQAQTSVPSTLNAAGGSKKIANDIYEYSIGEMVLVHTASSPNLIVTQGLLQPLEEAVGIAKLVLSEDALSVYPNPADDIVYVQPNITNGEGVLTLTLMDATGRQLRRQAVNLKSGKEKQSVSLKSLASGTYLLHAVFTRNNQDAVHNFKIQKIN